MSCSAKQIEAPLIYLKGRLMVIAIVVRSFFLLKKQLLPTYLRKDRMG
jgi:hypothetical protein